ncbi:MAG: serine hydrolase domain-containing protein [Nocardioides sp.]
MSYSRRRKVLLRVIVGALAVSVTVAGYLLFRPIVPRGGGATATTVSAPLAPAANDQVRGVAAATGADSVLVLQNGQIRYASGETGHLASVASVRKSVIAVLIGIAVDRGMIDPDRSLADLGIDETKTPLSQVEKSATVRDLLGSRSGVYLESGAETDLMRARRPERGTHPPGSYFYYNNWDFNTLGAIFEAETGVRIGDALHDWIGAPLNLQDFLPEHVTYAHDSVSRYRTWRLYLTPRDLARIGDLVASWGRVGERQVVSRSWIEEMLVPRSQTPDGDAYGYLWWIDQSRGIAYGSGWGGQFVMVSRECGLTVAVTNSTGDNGAEFLVFSEFGDRVSRAEAMSIYDTVARVVSCKQ